MTNPGVTTPTLTDPGPELAARLAGPLYVLVTWHPDPDTDWQTGPAVQLDWAEARACLYTCNRRNPARCLEVGAGRVTRDVTDDMLCPQGGAR